MLQVGSTLEGVPGGEGGPGGRQVAQAVGTAQREGCGPGDELFPPGLSGGPLLPSHLLPEEGRALVGPSRREVLD